VTGNKILQTIRNIIDATATLASNGENRMESHATPSILTLAQSIWILFGFSCAVHSLSSANQEKFAYYTFWSTLVWGHQVQQARPL
jgi:hypothetical protein